MASIQETLVQSLRQLGRLPRAQRIAVLLGVALIGVSLGWMVWWSARPEWVPLLDQPLEAQDLARVTTGLAMLDEPYTVAGTQVLVRAGADRQAILARLQQTGKLPADVSMGFAALVRESNPWISQEENRRRWTVALAAELERVLERFSGVREAHVFLDLASPRRSFSRYPAQGSASVTLRMDGDEPVPRSLALAAARLVAGAVRGLSLQRVQVLDAAGRPALDWEREQDSSNALHRLQREVETQVEKKIRELLAFDPKARVSVQAVLDYSSRNVEDTKPYDPVEIERTKTSESSTNAAPGNQPGVQPNVGVAVQPAATGSKTESETEKTRAQPGVKVSREATPAGEVKQVFAAVSLSYSYLRTLYRQLNPDAKQEPKEADIQQVFAGVKSRIEHQIAKLVYPPDAQQVAIDWYFDADQDAATGGAALGGAAASAIGPMLQRYGPVAALGGLALLSLMLLLKMARQGVDAEAYGLQIGLPTEAIQAAREAARDLKRAKQSEAVIVEEPEEELPAASQAEGVLEAKEVDSDTAEVVAMAEQVAQMVNQDPDSLASVLESWATNTKR